MVLPRGEGLFAYSEKLRVWVNASRKLSSQPPSWNGLQGVAAVTAGVVAARLVGRFGITPLRIFGALLQTAATALLILQPQPQQGGLILFELFVIMFGFGDVLALVMVSIQATTGVSDENQGIAGGFLTMAEQVGAGLGLAIAVAVATARTNSLVPAAPPLPALESGFQFALGAATVMTLIAILVGIILSVQGRQAK